jgi:hypothetical protein
MAAMLPAFTSALQRTHAIQFLACGMGGGFNSEEYLREMLPFMYPYDYEHGAADAPSGEAAHTGRRHESYFAQFTSAAWNAVERELQPGDLVAVTQVRGPCMRAPLMATSHTLITCTST